jgi:MFS family permease
LPAIQSGLHASFSDVQWVVDAYALTLASVLLTAGSLADRYGRRLLFTIGLVVFTLGSLLCGVAQSPLMLILSRSAQGIGGAILFSTSLALLAQSFQGKERGVAFGVWGGVTGVAVGLGPVLGGDYHHRHQLAWHLPGEPADRRGRTGHHPVASG